jgi:hypothetical protein
VPGDIIVPPSHWGTLILKPGPPGWVLDSRLRTLQSEKFTAANSREVIIGCNLATFSEEGYG